jgi:esterase/lipase superfamily enzyme
MSRKDATHILPFHLIVCLCLAVPCSTSNVHSQEATTPSSAAVDSQPQDWAREYIADDPLELREAVSLQDMRDGLLSPKRRDTVIAKHFGKVADASDEQKLDFLREALNSDILSVQQQALYVLQRDGNLEGVIRDILLEYLSSEEPHLREAAIIGLKHISIPKSFQSPQYWDSLLVALSNEDSLVAGAAAEQLRAMGYDSVPQLLNALRAAHPSSRRITEILSEIVGSNLERGAPVVEAMQAPQPESASIVGKGASEVPRSPSTPRSVDTEAPATVTVYYGTNRELIDRPKPGWSQMLPYPVVAILLVLAVWTFIKARPQRSDERRGCSRLVLPLIMIAGVIWALLTFRSELQQHWRLGSGPSFGPRRDAAEVVHYGTCEVSIPPKHEVGAIERPLIGPENEQEHVVLKRTDSLQEEAFFASIRNKLSLLPRSNKSCFVFIHGFNVDFENAARRTAQIHYDLRFEGVPIFFSWPSRANVRHYFSDRNEIEFSRYVIKQFLSDVAFRSDAERIHVIAHSMGADATCRAIAEMGESGKIFDQIILAAPDIDREVFRRQIAPRLTKTANRTTLYCSKNDLALLLSRNFNDSSRAGDSSGGALVIQDVDTVDASNIDTDLLGHSYYGDCLPLLNDVHDLIRASLSPADRRLRPWPVDEGLLYWTLPDVISDDALTPEESGLAKPVEVAL